MIRTIIMFIIITITTIYCYLCSKNGCKHGNAHSGLLGAPGFLEAVSLIPGVSVDAPRLGLCLGAQRVQVLV